MIKNKKLVNNQELKTITIIKELDLPEDQVPCYFSDIKTGNFFIIKINDELRLELKISEEQAFSFASLNFVEIENEALCYKNNVEFFSEKDLSDIKSYQLKPGEFALNDESELIMALTETDPINYWHSIWNFTKSILEDIEEIRSYHIRSDLHVVSL